MAKYDVTVTFTVENSDYYNVKSAESTIKGAIHWPDVIKESLKVEIKKQPEPLKNYVVLYSCVDGSTKRWSAIEVTACNEEQVRNYVRNSMHPNVKIKSIVEDKD
jgi:hypothetical protein